MVCGGVTRALMKTVINKSKNKWDLINIKSLVKQKKTTNKTKRQHIEWKKIPANVIRTNKGLISRIHKQLVQLNNRKTKQPNQKLSRRPE